MKKIKGNLISLAQEGAFDIIAHGCNTKKKEWGAGIVVAIKEAFPWAHDSYVYQLINADLNNESLIGKVDFCPSKDGKLIVANWFTQIYPGRCYDFGKDQYHNRLEYIRSCAHITNRTYPGLHIGVPQIGCGIAGLNWFDVEPILRGELNNMRVTVVIKEF